MESALSDDSNALVRELTETCPALAVVELAPIAPAADQPIVEDASAKWWVLDRGGEKLGILFHSPSVAPAAVARSCQRAAEARAALGELGCVIPVPITAGSANGRSYCVWPVLRELIQSKTYRRFQCGWLRCELTRWLIKAVGVTAQIITPDQVESHFRSPLLAMAADARQSSAARAEAEAAVHRIDGGKWRPKTALAHNDLWTGNVMVCNTADQRSENPQGFYVIDWGGSQIAGCPIFDLVVWSGSVGSSTKRLRRDVESNASTLDCNPQDAMGYLLTALARLGQNLEHFPEPRYLELCRQTFDRLRSTLT